MARDPAGGMLTYGEGFRVCFGPSREINYDRAMHGAGANIRVPPGQKLELIS
jgi:hypothetical protein